MNKKTWMIAAGCVGGAATLCALGVAVWNNKQFRRMRAVRRTNMIINRVGNALCKLSCAADECM